MKIVRITFLLFAAILMSTDVWSTPKTCSYTTYKWNVNLKKAVDFKRVKHSYSLLEEHEVDLETGCTVCEEDQILIKIGSLPAFQMCSILAGENKNALNRLITEGQPIYKVVAYRVGMTRGDIDSEGNRTRFSNHSFGIAIDINDQQNGLYDQCIEFGPNCRLRKGGEWKPGVLGTLTLNSRIVNVMKAIGLKWGGEIKGRQKDFMHFSPSGF